LRKYLAFLLLFLPSIVQAQATAQTAVSGIIVDPAGVPYYPTTVLACLFPVTIDPVVDGVHVNPNQGANYCIGPAQTTPTGAFTMALFPNGNIAPTGGTQWQFTVTSAGSAPPAGKGPQTFFVNITIAGATQNISSQLNAAAPLQLNSGGGGGNGNVIGTGTLNNVTCWLNANAIQNCPDLTDASGAPVINAPLVIKSGALASSVQLQEGPPANCLAPAPGAQILCSINSPDSLVLSSNGGAYAPLGTGGGGGATPGGAMGDVQINGGSGLFSGAAMNEAAGTLTLNETNVFTSQDTTVLLNGLLNGIGEQSEFIETYTAGANITKSTLVKFTGTADNVIPATTADTGNVIIGVAFDIATSGGQVQVNRWGNSVVILDNVSSCTGLEPIVNSTTVAAEGHCTTTPGTAQVIGVYMNTPGGDNIDIYPQVQVSGIPAPGTPGTLLFNNAGVTSGLTGWTGSGAGLNITAASGTSLVLTNALVTTGLKLPAATGAAPTSDGSLAFNTSTHCLVYGSNGSTVPLCSGGGGGGSGTWSSLSLGGTNTGTGMVLAPSATGTVPFTINAPSGQSVDIFDLNLNSIKQFWIDSTGNMNFLGTNFNVGSSTSTTAGIVAAHGGNTAALPGCLQTYANADTINTNLCSSATNGRMVMLQGPATSETVQYFVEEAPTTNAQTVASYTINSNVVAGAIDYGRIVTRSNASAMSDTLGQAGGGTGALTEFGFGNGWHTQIQVLPSSVGSDTITTTTSNFIGCDTSPAHTVVVSPGNSIELVSNGADWNCTRFAGSGGGGGSGISGLTTNGNVYASSPTTVATSTPPAVNGQYQCGYTVTGSATVAPTCPQVGLSGRSITGAATTDTVLYSDNATVVTHDIAASGAVNETLPTATTLGNADFVYGYANHSLQTDTITPTTWTIQAGTAAAGVSLSIPPGAFVRIKVDPNSATNWLADVLYPTKPLVGTDAGTATAATISTTVGRPVVSDANGGVTTTGGPPDLTASGSFWFPMGIYQPLTGDNHTLSAIGQPFMHLINLPVPVKVTNVTYNIQTGIAASTGDFGMYSISGTALTLAWHTGSVSTAATGTFTVTLGTPVTLAPGKYYIASCDSINTVIVAGSLRNAAGIELVLGGTAIAHSHGSNTTDTCTAGVLPGSQTSTNIVNSNSNVFTVPFMMITN
jgi:hypothetical protein